MTERPRRHDEPVDPNGVTRESGPEVAARPACPFCGSVATQPFTHAGPGARKRRKCTRCGRVFEAGRSG